jgi:hypothetical protein
MQNLKPEMITTSTSTSSFSPLKIFIPIEINKQEYDWINNNADKNNRNEDELFNECYDIIPLNNVKKNTVLNWILK